MQPSLAEPPVPSGNGAPRPAPAPWQSHVREIHNAFILGWSIVELRSRVQIAALDDTKLPESARVGAVEAATQISADPAELVTDKNSRLLRASRMRTVFNRVVSLQRARFPESVTIDTLYDPPPKEDLPYLYPPAPDYANIGIRPLEEADGPAWTDFRLFEITRRAVNCLTLLLVDPQESLVPAHVAAQQKRLITSVVENSREELAPHAEAYADPDVTPAASVPSLAATAMRACGYASSPAGFAEVDTPPGPGAEHEAAIVTLTFLTVRLLQAWDGYLRERFTGEGVDADNLTALVAYEAGRNMASISWNVSVNAIPLENAGDDAGATAGKLYAVWQSAFNESSVLQVLHQITALSTVFDDAYYLTRERPAALISADPLDDLLVAPDPALPSQILQAVQQSVEYWQRTVAWLGAADETPQGMRTVKKLKHLRAALIEQSGIWFNLMTGQQDLRGYTVTSVSQKLIDDALADLSELAQRDLPAATRQAVQQVGDLLDTAAELVVEISREATDAAKAGIGRVANANRFLLPALIIIPLVAIVLFFVLPDETQASIITALAGGLTTVLGWLGIRNAEEKSEANVEETIDRAKEAKTQTIQKEKSGLQSALDFAEGSVRGVLAQAGDFVVEAYDKGLRRIQIELKALDYNISVAHPLVEFFIRHEAVEGDIDFLNKVIWDATDREAQRRRVITAAFGPLSLLITRTAAGDGEAGGAE